MPGKPDFLFAKEKVAVFCDGDFWHGRKLKERLRRVYGGHNAAYWVAKIQANVRRDRQNTNLLRKAGWRVMRVWESAIQKMPEIAANRVEVFVRALRSRPESQRKGTCG